MTTGLDLKIERVRSRLTVRRLARAMGVSGQRISQIEGLAVVTAEAESRYREAIRSLTDGTQNVA